MVGLWEADIKSMDHLLYRFGKRMALLRELSGWQGSMWKDTCRVQHRFAKSLGRVIVFETQLSAFRYPSYDFLSYSSMCDFPMSSIYFTSDLPNIVYVYNRL